MKTFETEKHNIPEGATHYSNETRDMYFAWRNAKGESQVTSVDLEWMMFSPVREWKPIPQTNIETPEEKEVEWVNGDDVEAYGKLYKYVGLDPFNDNLCICLANQDDDPQCFSIEVLNKPETEAERVEREREDAINEMSLIVESGNGFAGNAYKKYCASLYDAGYRKESE